MIFTGHTSIFGIYQAPTFIIKKTQYITFTISLKKKFFFERLHLDT